MRNKDNEYLSRFACAKHDCEQLQREAELEARQILKEFAMFFRANLDIKIEAKRHVTCWSIAATLMLNNEPVREYECCDLLFLELNEMMLKRMCEMNA